MVIVADTSYIVEGLLSNKQLLSRDQIIAPELIIYEATNIVWKHEKLLKSIQNGETYLSLLFGLIESGKITIVSSDENLIQDTYTAAKRNGITPYDAIFVCLAVKLGTVLKTLDRKQKEVYEKEKSLI